MNDEVRTTSTTGGQKGVKPEMLSLLPRRGLEAIARVFGFGTKKYAAHNWRKKYEWSKGTDSALRHILAHNDGETYDPESGEPHLAHAAFHLLTQLTWLLEDGEGADNPMDDRWPAAMERARREEDVDFTQIATWTSEAPLRVDGVQRSFDRLTTKDLRF